MRFVAAFRGVVSSALSVGVVLGFCCRVGAQQGGTATLEEILGRLEVNLKHYDQDVPSLFCDEDVVSTHREPGMRAERRVTDSVFRLRREAGGEGVSALVESREVRKVDGRAATRAPEMSGPTLLEGAFEGGMAVVSEEQAGCMRYELEPVRRRRAGEPYEIRFSTALTPENRERCFLEEESTGRVLVDPVAMQVTRLEVETPHHVIRVRDSFAEPVEGARFVTVDYAPVRLGEETFWMPTTILLRVTRGGSGFGRMEWGFRASYKDYHKGEGRARIVAGSEVPVR